MTMRASMRDDRRDTIRRLKSRGTMARVVVAFLLEEKDLVRRLERD
jgi:hypothetical protein